MKLILTTSILIALTAAASARAAIGPMRFEGGALRLGNGLEGAATRNIWLRSRSMVLVWPGATADAQVLKPEKGAIKEARISTRNGRTELELKLGDRAEVMLPRLILKPDGNDLLVGFEPRREGAAQPEPQPPPTPPPATAPAVAARVASSPTVAPIPTTAPALPRRFEASPERLAPRTAARGGSSPAIWVIGLLVVAGGALAWWTRKRRRRTDLENLEIEVVSARALSGKNRLVLVETAGELLLLGCTDREIRLLKVVDRHKLAENQSRTEAAFFDAGVEPPVERNEDEAAVEAPAPAAAPAPASASKPAQPRQPASNDRTLSAAVFVESLSRQLRQREAAQHAGSVVRSEEGNPLNERWAEGILKLRRARASSGDLQ